MSFYRVGFSGFEDRFHFLSVRAKKATYKKAAEKAALTLASKLNLQAGAHRVTLEALYACRKDGTLDWRSADEFEIQVVAKNGFDAELLSFESILLGRGHTQAGLAELRKACRGSKKNKEWSYKAMLRAMVGIEQKKTGFADLIFPVDPNRVTFAQVPVAKVNGVYEPVGNQDQPQCSGS